MAALVIVGDTMIQTWPVEDQATFIVFEFVITQPRFSNWSSILWHWVAFQDI